MIAIQDIEADAYPLGQRTKQPLCLASARSMGPALLTVALLGLTGSGWAAEKVRHSQPDVLKFPLSGIELIPLFDLSETYNDNVLQNDAIGRRKDILRPGDSIDSMVTKVQAGVEAAVERHRNRFALQYALRSLNFHSSPNDDYVDQFVGGATHFEFTRRNRLDLLARFIDGHYQRGTNFSQLFGLNNEQLKDALTTEPDQFHQYLFEGQYRYGAPSAKGNLELKFHLDDITFQNNRSYADGRPRTLGWDRRDIVITPGFYYRIRPKTHLLAQVELEFLDYHNDFSNIANQLFRQPGQDYEKQRFLLGLTWERSAKTTGNVRIGYLNQNFTRADLAGLNEFTWDVGVTWRPQTYSAFILNLSRDAYPTLGFGNVRLIDSYGLAWRHNWSDRISSMIDAYYQQVDNYPIKREDDIFSARLNVNYAFRPWLHVGVNYVYNNQDSSAPFKDLVTHQNLAMVYVSTNRSSVDRIVLPWRSW